MKTKLLIIAVLTATMVLMYSCKQERTTAKTRYIPQNVYMVPDSNDYSNPTSDFCFDRMVESKNIALFWHKEYGMNPMENHDSTRRFNPNEAINECERFYEYYVDELKLIEKGNSLADTFKLLIYVIGGDEGTAFGGGEENKIGILWTPAVRINKKPYGALAHEMAHCFQYLSEADTKTGVKGPIIEMSAQYMLWQVYPEWMTFENYHLEAFLKNTYRTFLHPANMYHSPYVLEYWAEKHGKDFYGKLSRQTKPGEDPVATYKRITGISQEEFNDEIFDASRKFVTWDLKRVEKVAAKYANIHFTQMHKINDDWYQIDSMNCPQNYGYNAIQLKVPEAGTPILLQFKGTANADGFSHYNIDKAGWRYGFVASLKDGSRIYSEIYKEAEGTANFTVPENCNYLWLVVSGAPTEHWPVVFRWGPPKPDDPKEEQWPYQIKISGTSLKN